MAVPTIEDLTDTLVGGDGVFDKIMCASIAHVDTQWDKDRIKGGEYATVYLSTLQTAWATSLQFVIQRDQAALTQAQTELAIQQQDLVAQQIILAQKQVDKLDAEILIAAKQLEIMEIEKGKTDAERLKIIAETAIVPKQGALIDEQRNKVVSETALMVQKKKTEAAQTDGTQHNSNSILGRQAELYLAQTNGYRSDKIQKAAKIMADSLGVRMATDTGAASSSNQMSDPYVGQAIAKLLGDMNT